MIETSRRSFITGLVSLVAAPAIVRAGSLMPVKAISDEDIYALIAQRIKDAEAVMINNINRNLYGELCDATRRAFVPRLYVQLYDAMPTFDGIAHDTERVTSGGPGCTDIADPVSRRHGGLSAGPLTARRL